MAFHCYWLRYCKGQNKHAQNYIILRKRPTFPSPILPHPSVIESQNHLSAWFNACEGQWQNTVDFYGWKSGSNTIFYFIFFSISFSSTMCTLILYDRGHWDFLHFTVDQVSLILQTLGRVCVILYCRRKLLK